MAKLKTIQNISEKGLRLNHWFKAGFLTLLVVLPLPALGSQDPLLMGIFPRYGTKLTFEMFTPTTKNLSTLLDRQVVLGTSANFKDFWNGVMSIRYDIVHYNQYHYKTSEGKRIFEHARFTALVMASDQDYNRLRDNTDEVFGENY